MHAPSATPTSSARAERRGVRQILPAPAGDGRPLRCAVAHGRSDRDAEHRSPLRGVPARDLHALAALAHDVGDAPGERLASEEKLGASFFALHEGEEAAFGARRGATHRRGARRRGALLPSTILERAHVAPADRSASNSEEVRARTRPAGTRDRRPCSTQGDPSGTAARA